MTRKGPKFTSGEKVRWKLTFDSEGAEIIVKRFIPGTGAAYIGRQIPEGHEVVFFEQEVEVVEDFKLDRVKAVARCDELMQQLMAEGLTCTCRWPELHPGSEHAESCDWEQEFAGCRETAEQEQYDEWTALKGEEV